MGRLSGIPHIVDIYQATFTDDGRPCIVMPLLEGGSLADRLQSGPLSPREVQQIGITIAEALDQAHRKGICHRDIKPENVLLASDGSPGLTDFGIAVMEDSRVGTQTQGAVSPQHAPPERLALADPTGTCSPPSHPAETRSAT
jgi:serine/threonine protein kinase